MTAMATQADQEAGAGGQPRIDGKTRSDRKPRFDSERLLARGADDLERARKQALESAARARETWRDAAGDVRSIMQTVRQSYRACRAGLRRVKRRLRREERAVQAACREAERAAAAKLRRLRVALILVGLWRLASNPFVLAFIVFAVLSVLVPYLAPELLESAQTVTRRETWGL